MSAIEKLATHDSNGEIVFQNVGDYMGNYYTGF